MFKSQKQVFHKLISIQLLLFQIDLSYPLVSLDMEILSPVLNIYSSIQNLLILYVFSLKYNSHVCFGVCVWVWVWFTPRFVFIYYGTA